MSDLETFARLRRVFAGEVGAAEVGDAAEALIAAIEPVADPEIECSMVVGAIRNDYSGIEGLRAAWIDLLAGFDRMRVELGEIEEVGDAFVDIVDLIGVPKGTEAEIHTPAGAVWWFREGTLRRIEFHSDRDAARRSAARESP